MISNFSLLLSPFLTMPHPERCFRSAQMSYKPTEQFTGDASPWLKMFQNARNYVG